MTVTNDTRRQFFNGTGSVTAFDFQIKYYNADEISVYVSSVLIDPSAYTLTANASGDGGTVTFTTAPAAGTRNVLITAELEYTQETAIPTVDKLGRGVLETVADKTVMLTQQLKDITDRCVKFALTVDNADIDLDIPAPSAGKALIWNDTEDGLTNSEGVVDGSVADAEAAATAAAASATSAASSASAAATSASSASTSASSASTSASTASTAATNASTSASTASTAATNASTSASTASTAATNASTSASTASTAATNASTSASTASTAATNASTSATNAASSATSAASSATAAAASAASVNLPSMVGNALKVLRANAGESGLEYVTAGAGTVTSVATAGLATGGPITGSGTVTVTAASTTEALTGTDTTKAATVDAIAALWEKGADTASASSITVPEGGYFHITGTTTITAFSNTGKSGRRIRTVFDGALQLTHNATSFILPGAANITTAAGDSAEWEHEGSGNWRCTQYTVAATAPGAGGGGTAATQAEEEAGSSTSVFTTPGRQHFHPSAAKFWANVKQTATQTLNGSYNVTSITDGGDGKTTVTIATDFSDTNYAAVATAEESGGNLIAYVNSKTAGTTVIQVINTATSATDATGLFVVGFGDHA